MSSPLEILSSRLNDTLGDKLVGSVRRLGELTIELRPADLLEAMKTLRHHPDLRFEQLIDLCGVDYQGYGEGVWEGRRFAVVYHLLSVSGNQRLRVRVFAEEDGMPMVDSVIELWPAANWFEREAFDLYGIIFAGHPDLRRLLTDYGFIGYPFRKDFPLVGNVEMRYDPDQQRVIYQPVSIEERNMVPRSIPPEGYRG